MDGENEEEVNGTGVTKQGSMLGKKIEMSVGKKALR